MNPSDLRIPFGTFPENCSIPYGYAIFVAAVPFICSNISRPAIFSTPTFSFMCMYNMLNAYCCHRLVLTFSNTLMRLHREILDVLQVAPSLYNYTAFCVVPGFDDLWLSLSLFRSSQFRFRSLSHSPVPTLFISSIHYVEPGCSFGLPLFPCNDRWSPAN